MQQSRQPKIRWTMLLLSSSSLLHRSVDELCRMFSYLSFILGVCRVSVPVGWFVVIITITLQ